jgi:hypothetical protein
MPLSWSAGPACRRLFQPDEPLNHDLFRQMMMALLSYECPNHVRFPEVIEN